MIYSLLGILAALAALAAIPALGDQSRAPEYPPGLFENSPVVGSDPGAPAPGALTIDPAPEDDCAGIASRLFHSLAEVRAARARCGVRPDPGEQQ